MTGRQLTSVLRLALLVLALDHALLVVLTMREKPHEEQPHEENFEKPALKKATVRCWAGGDHTPVVNVEFYAGTWRAHGNAAGWASFTDPKTNEEVTLRGGLCVKREKVGGR